MEMAAEILYSVLRIACSNFIQVQYNVVPRDGVLDKEDVSNKNRLTFSYLRLVPD